MSYSGGPTPPGGGRGRGAPPVPTKPSSIKKQAAELEKKLQGQLSLSDTGGVRPVSSTTTPPTAAAVVAATAVPQGARGGIGASSPFSAQAQAQALPTTMEEMIAMLEQQTLEQQTKAQQQAQVQAAAPAPAFQMPSISSTSHQGAAASAAASPVTTLTDDEKSDLVENVSLFMLQIRSLKEPPPLPPTPGSLGPIQIEIEPGSIGLRLLRHDVTIHNHIQTMVNQGDFQALKLTLDRLSLIPGVKDPITDNVKPDFKELTNCILNKCTLLGSSIAALADLPPGSQAPHPQNFPHLYQHTTMEKAALIGVLDKVITELLHLETK